MWSAGISLFTTAPRWERIKRVLFNPGIIAVELGLLRMLFEPDLPLVAVSAIHALGECTTPLAMIIVGMILAEIPLKNFLSSKALLLSAIRQLFMPLVLLLSLHGLHIDPLLTAVANHPYGNAYRVYDGHPLLQNMGPMRNLLLPVSLRQP